MKIALDYDGTYTRDPEFWKVFIMSARIRGHEIAIVTMRFPEEKLDAGDLEVIYTSRQAKARHYQADVWIDDMPLSVLQGAA